MIGETPGCQVYLACGSTDMRKSIDGLAALVQVGFQLDPFSSCLFVFCNRGRDKIKILQWDHTGSGCTTAGWSADGSSGRPGAPPSLSVTGNSAGCWTGYR